MAKSDAKAFSAELLDQLLASRDSKSVLDFGGLIGDLKKPWPGACWAPRWTFT